MLLCNQYDDDDDNDDVFMIFPVYPSELQKKCR